MANGLAPRTVDLHFTTLGKMVGVLENLEIVPKGINSKPKSIRPKKVTAPKFWTGEEVERILKAPKGSYIYSMLVVALNLGLRQNEIRYLRWDNINLGRGFL